MKRKHKKDLTTIRAHWENPDIVSLKDRNLQELERHCILQCLKKIGNVESLADFGCGDASDTICFSRYAKKTFGYDYSLAMLNKAKNIVKDNIVLSHLDLLQDRLDKKFDIVITKRCLINLGNFRNQAKSIKDIYKCLKKGGYYIMLECSLDGLKNLNNLRRKFGLDPLKEPFHNVYFELAKLRKVVGKYFTIEDSKYFSTYYFLTRIYNQIVDKSGFQRLDFLAKESHFHFDFLSSICLGPQFLLVLKKKA
ncbi:MAG: class I SAM-dependent methyltransferase [Candidatus Omnitrophota bacterium]